MSELFAGVDLGTTSIRAAVFDSGGGEIASDRWELDTVRGPDGSAQQAPAQWLDGLLSWFESFPGLTGWSVGGQMNTYCLTDRQGAPITDAITWQDRRRGRQDRGTAPFTAFSSRARLLAEQYPQAWQRAAWALLPKDVLVAAMTGQVRGDRLSWNGVLDLQSQELTADLAADAAALVPQLGEPTDTLPSRCGTAALGLPDTVAVVVGCGLRRGTIYSLTGTSETLAQVGHRAEPSHGFRSSVPVQGDWLHVGPSSVGGATLQWAADVLTGGAVDALIALATSVAPRPELPFFRPYLLGERAPLWNSELTGAWEGMRGDHGRAELAFAVLEGVGFSLRHGIEQLSRSTGEPATDVVCTISSRDGLQARAEALGMPLRGTQDHLIGCRGAAAVAYAAHHGTDLASASAALASESGWIVAQPSGDYPPGRFERWRELSIPSS